MPAPHIPNDITRAQVRAMAAFLPQKHVAKYIGITRKTLRKHYPEELNTAMDKDMQVVSGLFENAINGNVAAQIFWCKTRLGMTENVANGIDEDDDTDDNSVGKIEIEVVKVDTK